LQYREHILSMGRNRHFMAPRKQRMSELISEFFLMRNNHDHEKALQKRFASILPSACSTRFRNLLERFALVFIPPATLFRDHHLTDTGIFGYPRHAGS